MLKGRNRPASNRADTETKHQARLPDKIGAFYCDASNLTSEHVPAQSQHPYPMFNTSNNQPLIICQAIKARLPFLAGIALVLAPSSGSASPQQPAVRPADPSTHQTADAPANLLPAKLQVHWQNLAPTADISSVSFEWDGKLLRYEVLRPANVKVLKSDKRSIVPSESSWKEFWKSMKDVEAWKWLNHYQGADSKADRAWVVVIDHDAKEMKSAGTNSYPSLGDVRKPTQAPVVWNRFCYALDLLVAQPIEVEGIYLAGFETSRFNPSSGEYRGQMWWLWSNQDFNDRYQKLSPKEETPQFAGPQVFARIRGKLAGPGQYGHLNQYSHELWVEEVLEMKKPQKKDR